MAGKSREDLERQIGEQQREKERLREENARLERELERLREDRDRLQGERDRLERERDQLEKELETARRAAKRQAAPFSKGAPTPTPRRPGRKPGRAYGPRAWRSVPDQVDEVVEVLPPRTCPSCGGAIAVEAVHVQYQADLPPVHPHVTAFHVHVGRCRRCGRRAQGRDARQTSTARGAAASQVGPRALAWAAWLHTGLGVPFAKVATILRTGFGLAITPGGLVQALHRVAARSAPTYHALITAVRRSAVVAPDETGWKVGGRLWWLWVFVAPDVTVYAIQPGRGYPQAVAILGARYAGVLVRDGWAPYRKLRHATHQTCLAHLLRRAHLLLETAQRGAARFPHAVRRLLLRALALRARRARGELRGHGLRVALGRLEAHTDRVLAGRVTPPRTSASCSICGPSGRRSSPASPARTSRRRIGRPSRRSGPPSSRAKSAAATARRGARRPSRSWRACCAPRGSSTVIPSHCSSRCNAVRIRSSRTFSSQAPRHPDHHPVPPGANQRRFTFAVASHL